MLLNIIFDNEMAGNIFLTIQKEAKSHNRIRDDY